MEMDNSQKQDEMSGLFDQAYNQVQMKSLQLKLENAEYRVTDLLIENEGMALDLDTLRKQNKSSSIKRDILTAELAKALEEVTRLSISLIWANREKLSLVTLLQSSLREAVSHGDSSTGSTGC